MTQHKDPIAKDGMRIRMINMNDQHPVDEGLEGTITNIDDIGTIHVNWDDGSTLGVIPEIDKYELLPAVDKQIDIDVFEGSNDFKISNAAKKNKLGKKLGKEFKKVLSKKNAGSIKVESDKIKGGKAEGLTVQDIAKKHKVPIGNIRKEIKLGTKIEMEHTDSKTKAKEITMDHITEYPDYYSNKKYGVKASEKGLEKDLEETSTAGGVSTGAFVGPLGSKKETIIKKPFAKQIGKEVVGKKSMSNPIGKIYTVTKKLESRVTSKKNLINELSSNDSTKLRDAEGTYDGDAWVGKNGWIRKDELAWEGGEIADILAKMNINWNDSDLSLTDKETDKINEGEKKKTKESPIHTKKWERCVKDVKKQNKKDGKDYDPYAVCTASIGYKGSIKKPHRKKKEEEIEETTTHASVWGVNGPPVVPIFGAKGKDHIPSRKPIWKGGKIVQKINNSGVLTEEMTTEKPNYSPILGVIEYGVIGESKLFKEINKIKWVKGGKYVRIKDKCAKYNNQPWCSQGAIDDPLELSDTVFENIKKVSKKVGIEEGEILDRIKVKLRGVSKEQMGYNKEHGLPIWWKGSKEGFYEKMEPRKNYTGSN